MNPSVAPAPADEANALRELHDAHAALDAATRACDEALRAWESSSRRWDRRALDDATRGFIAAQRRVSLAQAAAKRAAPRSSPRGVFDEKAWGSH